jgi:BirA family biotin operon repressor/biotin-[acetyl-CoA-carboxylase] ligase
MALTGDLAAEVLGPLLPGRAVRSYPALLSSEVDAEAWARAGGPHGGVVTAGYLAAPRGRAGLPWPLGPDRGLVFSLLLRPDLTPEREGFPYLAAGLGLADVLGPDAVVRWPDEVHGPDGRLGAVGLRTELGPDGVRWAVLTMLAEHVGPPRGPLLARIVAAVEGRLDDPIEALLAAYRARCGTLGRRVRARLVPLGPAGPQLEGEAVDVRGDGALVIRTEEGRRAVVPPPNLGMLEDLDADLDLRL